jgi:hypothetical protein
MSTADRSVTTQGLARFDAPHVLPQIDRTDQRFAMLRLPSHQSAAPPASWTRSSHGWLGVHVTEEISDIAVSFAR